MLSIQYYPFGCQNGQQNRQHSSLRIAGSATPMLSVHAVHFTLRSSFQAQYSTARRELVEFPSEPTRNVLILEAGAPAPSTVGLMRKLPVRIIPGGQPLGVTAYQDSDNFSTTSFLAKTREHSSQRFLSGSIVSL